MNGSGHSSRARWVQGGLLLTLAVVAGMLLVWHMPLTRWQVPTGARAWVAVVAVGAWMLTLPWPWHRRAKTARQTPDTETMPETRSTKHVQEPDPWLVVCASQTGVAEELSEHTAATLERAGLPVQSVDLGTLDEPALARASRILFVVSTTGDGDAPDPAAGFASRIMTRPAELAHLQYGLLALGDSDYDDFCGFGHKLDRWLRAQGATTLFDPVEVDDEDPDALRRWQHHLGVLGGGGEVPDWEPPQYRSWRLVERRELNPGSVGDACFHVACVADDVADMQWQAGDIAEIGPHNDPAAVEAFLAALALDGRREVDAGRGSEPLAGVLSRSHLPDPAGLGNIDAASLLVHLEALPHREYSIASLPADGALHLLVRQMWHPDGRPGLGSSWLVRHVPVGGSVDLRIRSNPNFRPPTDARPLVLVGNGTGIAGLRALLKARMAAGHHDNWLFFGERQSAVDHFYAADIERWRGQEYLSRVDLAFSRDQDERVYVQHLLAECATDLRKVVAAGAAIHVCGSLAMGRDVDAVLAGVLGGEVLEAMTIEGRYRRDVY